VYKYTLHNKTKCKLYSQVNKNNNNKSTQSNLGRGPRGGAVAHVGLRRSPVTDPQTPLPASSLEPSDLWCQTASGSDPPFFHNALDRPTDARTHQQTDRSSTGKFDEHRPLRL